MFKALGPTLLAAALSTAALAQTAPTAPSPAAPAPAPSTAAPDPVPPAPPAAGDVAPGPADWRPLDPANTLLIETTKGRIIVEMHPELTPVAVGRIKALTRMGYYNGSLFYRVLDFMAQTGDNGAKRFTSTLPNMKAEPTFQLRPGVAYTSFAASSAGDVGFIGAMPVVIEADPALPAGQKPATGRGYVTYCPGTAAFAHTAASIDSANSQIFLMRLSGYAMEKKYTAWGRVIDGQDVVAALNNGAPPKLPDKMVRVRVLADVPRAERPALQVMDTRSPAFAAMLQQALAAKGRAFNICEVKVPTKAG